MHHKCSQDGTGPQVEGRVGSWPAWHDQCGDYGTNWHNKLGSFLLVNSDATINTKAGRDYYNNILNECNLGRAKPNVF